MTDTATLTLRAIGGLAEVDGTEWNACAGTANPFVDYAFLSALEDSGSVAPETGWAPRHLLLEDPDGRLIGAVPMYLKNHSQGEFVFDYGWAHAFERAGGNYYPKLQISVPFTPATGPRLLVREGLGFEETAGYLVQGMIEVARQLEVSSLHITYPTKREWSLLGTFGMLQRTGEQFHWQN